MVSLNIVVLQRLKVDEELPLFIKLLILIFFKGNLLFYKVKSVLMLNQYFSFLLGFLTW